MLAQIQEASERWLLKESERDWRTVETVCAKLGAHEGDVKALSRQVGELEHQGEAALREGCELKTQLKMVEKAPDGLRRELLEMQHLARELEAVFKAARKKALELRRVQPELVHDVIAHAGDELRAPVKSAENEKSELARGLTDAKHLIGVVEEQISVALKECSELRQNLRKIEKRHLDARRELHELRRHLKSLDAERTLLAKELENELVRIEHDEQARHELFGLKQKLTENEVSLEILRCAQLLCACCTSNISISTLTFHLL